MKVGLSLSYCIRDLLEGTVKLEDVAFIFSGTKAEKLEHWDQVIEGYLDRGYWDADPEEGKRLCLYFVENNLILQPRLEGKRLYCGRDIVWIEADEFNDFVKDKLFPSR